MGNGKRPLRNGEMGNGATGNGRCEVGNGRHTLGNGKRETGNALVTYWTEWCHQEKDPPTKRERERFAHIFLVDRVVPPRARLKL